MGLHRSDGIDWSADGDEPSASESPSDLLDDGDLTPPEGMSADEVLRLLSADEEPEPKNPLSAVTFDESASTWAESAQLAEAMLQESEESPLPDLEDKTTWSESVAAAEEKEEPERVPGDGPPDVPVGRSGARSRKRRNTALVIGAAGFFGAVLAGALFSGGGETPVSEAAPIASAPASPEPEPPQARPEPRKSPRSDQPRQQEPNGGTDDQPGNDSSTPGWVQNPPDGLVDLPPGHDPDDGTDPTDPSQEQPETPEPSQPAPENEEKEEEKGLLEGIIGSLFSAFR